MYTDFASVYDELMDDFDYGAWADYYLSLLGRAGLRPRAVADCGCGTGSMSIELARRGLMVTGLDISNSMLMRAGEKARRAGLTIPFVRQDMRQLRLHRPMDAVIAACDGVNYLLDERQVRAFFRSAFAALRPGGCLAFDISTREKLLKLPGAPYYEDREDLSYFWTTERDAREYILHMELSFFVREADGRYRRFDERQTQRAHGVDELINWLLSEGFCEPFAAGADGGALSAGELRAHFVAKKPE